MNVAGNLFSNKSTPLQFCVSHHILALTCEECLTENQIEQDNVKLVSSFLKEAFEQHDISSVDKYFSPDYIEHNPDAADGKQPLKDFIRQFDTYQTTFEIYHTSANGDLVWNHLKRTGFNGVTSAIVDIFRAKEGKIVEHWDVIQEVPALAKSKNSHPMF